MLSTGLQLVRQVEDRLLWAQWDFFTVSQLREVQAESIT